MSEVKWIKITTDMFEDEKIDFIQSLPEADSIIIIWVRLLAMAGKCNSNGYIFLAENILYDENMLAYKFKKSINVVRLALETLKKLKMIENNENGIVISKWSKHQNIEGLDKIREQTRTRVSKNREKQRLLNECNVTCNATVTHGNATELDIDIDIDKDIDIDIDKDIDIYGGKNPKPTKFLIPGIKSVKEYCIARKNNVDAEKFIDFYSAKGWMIGKNKMKDWKAAVRTWERGTNDKAVINKKGDKNGESIGDSKFYTTQKF